MAREVSLADAAARTIADRAPRLLVIAGATGTGKSTASVQLAADIGFSRLLSTDAVREIMRSCDEERQQPARPGRDDAPEPRGAHLRRQEMAAWFEQPLHARTAHLSPKAHRAYAQSSHKNRRLAAAHQRPGERHPEPHRLVPWPLERERF